MQINFTGLSIDSENLYINKHFAGPYPNTWVRLKMDNGYSYNNPKFKQYLMENTLKRFGIFFSHLTSEMTLYFEDPADAVFFKLNEDELKKEIFSNIF